MPAVADDERVETADLGRGFYRVRARYGFMETPDVPDILARSEPIAGDLNPAQVTYYLGRQTLLSTPGGELARWRKRLFRFLFRSALRPTAYFGLPPNRVVELGAQIQF